MKCLAVYLTLLVGAAVCELNVQKYLQKYGFSSSGNGFSVQSLSDSLKQFQKTFHLKPTGILDAPTKTLMTKPRCGRSDHGGHSFNADSKWNKKSLTYYYHNYTPDMTNAKTRQLTEQALKYWTDVSQLSFSEKSKGDIVIAFGAKKHTDGKAVCDEDFDGPGGVLAHALLPPYGLLHFDEDETYTFKSKTGINYLWVAVHEMGHVLGLEHDQDNTDAVMYPFYREYDPNGMKLHSNDVKRIQLLYGAKGGPPVMTSKPTQQPTNVVTNNPPTSVITNNPGGCKDIDPDCHYLVSYCNKAQTKQWMTQNCAKTCNRCPTGPSCVDKDRDCQVLVDAGLCTDNDLKTWMSQVCAKSCNKCT